MLVRTTGRSSSLPDSVEAVIAGDIDRLSPADRTVLRYASVLGTTLRSRLLAAALDQEIELDEDIWDTASGISSTPRRATGEHRFRNTLIRDAAYEGLPFRRQAGSHARVGEAIEATAGENDVGRAGAPLLRGAAATTRRGATAVAGENARVDRCERRGGAFYERLSPRANGFDLEGEERATTWIVARRRARGGGALRPLRSRPSAGRRGLLRGDRVGSAQRLRTAEPGRARAPGRSGWRCGRRRPGSGSSRAIVEERRRGPRVARRDPVRDPLAAGPSARGDRDRGGGDREVRSGAGELEALARAYTALDGAYQMLGQPEKAVHERMLLEIYTQARTYAFARRSIELNLGVQAYADGAGTRRLPGIDARRVTALAAGDRQSAAVAGVEPRRASRQPRRASTKPRRCSPRLDTSCARRAARRSRSSRRRSSHARARAGRATTAARVAVQRLVDEAAGIGHAGIALEITIYYRRRRRRGAGEPPQTGSTHSTRPRATAERRGGLLRGFVSARAGRLPAALGAARGSRASALDEPSRAAPAIRASSTSNSSHSGRALAIMHVHGCDDAHPRSCARPNASRSSSGFEVELR